MQRDFDLKGSAAKSPKKIVSRFAAISTRRPLRETKMKPREKKPLESGKVPSSLPPR
jgi:hypothetical protein